MNLDHQREDRPSLVTGSAGEIIFINTPENQTVLQRILACIEKDLTEKLNTIDSGINDEALRSNQKYLLLRMQKIIIDSLLRDGRVNFDKLKETIVLNKEYAYLSNDESNTGKENLTSIFRKAWNRLLNDIT